RFAEINRAQRVAYVSTLLLLTLASLLFIAPAAQHRVLFRQDDKEALLLRSTRYARVASTVLLAALALGVYFVVEMVYPGPVAVAASVAALVVGAWLWIAVPHGLRRAAPARSDTAPVE
ncbi:MAG: rane protein, partial [Frankiales bacterium]|nr:rane protein [Frankiales bacterium]